MCETGDAIHCVGRSCLEAVTAMERRLLVDGGLCADHGQGQGVTVRIEVLERTPALRHCFFRLRTGCRGRPIRLRRILWFEAAAVRSGLLRWSSHRALLHARAHSLLRMQGCCCA
jgi:hypothetical protein